MFSGQLKICLDIATVLILTILTRKAKRRSTREAEAGQSRDPRAQGKRDQDPSQETNGRREVGPGIVETASGAGAERGGGAGPGVEAEEEVGVEIDEGAEVGIESGVGAPAETTENLSRFQGLSLEMIR